MLGRTHLAFGILSSVIIYHLLPISDPPLFFVLVAIGSLLPDIDHHNSTINKLLPVTKVFSAVFTHRGFFHSIFPIGILYILFYSIGYPLVGAYLGIGYLSHLISDACTVMGVNFLHPFTSMKARGFITVGTMEETLFFWLMVAVTGYLMVT
jgi:inner membrane protein